MIAHPKVMSLRFVSSDMEPAGYLMVQTDDLQLAKAIARRWAEQKLNRPFDTVEEHHGLMDPPGLEMSEVFEGVRVWELPF